MSQLLIGTKPISLALLVAEKTLLLGRLARQGRPIAFAGFLIILIILPPYFTQHSEDLELSFKNHMIGFRI